MEKDDPTARAVAWHVRLSSDSVETADFEEFARWVSETRNRAAYDRLDRALATLGGEPSSFSRALDGNPPETAPQRRSLVSRVPTRIWIVAAMASAAAVLALIFLPVTPPVWTTYATANEPRLVHLIDGSTVHLNRNSTLRVSMQADARRTILDGEAIFDVMHEPARQFTVQAGDARIRVLGTEFDVLKAKDRTSITVRRGLVRVALEGGEVGLRAGEQCRVLAGRCVTRRIDPDTAFAWRTGRLVYADVALGDVLSDLNRYYDRPVRAVDEQTESLRFSGVLVLDEQDKIVSRLEAFLPVVAERNADDIVLRAADRR